MLIDWGITQAETKGCPAYVEASVMGKPVYERRGFECVGEPLVCDGRQFGIEKDFVVNKMVRCSTDFEAGSQAVVLDSNKPVVLQS